MFKLFGKNKKADTENLVNKTEVDSANDNKDIVIVKKTVSNSTEYTMYSIKVLINCKMVYYSSIQTLNQPFISDRYDSLSEEYVDSLFVRAKKELIDFIKEKNLVESEILVDIVYDFDKPDGERAYIKEEETTLL